MGALHPASTADTKRSAIARATAFFVMIFIIIDPFVSFFVSCEFSIAWQLMIKRVYRKELFVPIYSIYFGIILIMP